MTNSHKISKTMATMNNIPSFFNNDLEAISGYAATEIDNFILKRPGKFYAVPRLISMINKSITSCGHSTPDRFNLNTTTALAMYRALEDYDPNLKSTLYTTEQLINESGKFTENLETLIQHPLQVKTEDLARLRSLCISLSESASACEDPLEDIESEFV